MAKASPLRVLGAGLPRTGTASLKAALEILGYGPTYHMFVVFEEAHRSVEWQRIYREIDAGNDTPGFATVFEGFTSAVDAPASEVWESILKEYPDIKIILTHRDAEAWWASMSATIMNVLESKYIWPLLMFWVPRVYQQWKWARLCMRPRWISKYGSLGPHIMDQRVKEVEECVPPQQLLNYRTGSGWEPLCEFLGEPIPDVPYPRVNDKDAFGKYIQKQVMVGLTRWAFLIAGTGVTWALAKKYF